MRYICFDSSLHLRKRN